MLQNPVKNIITTNAEEVIFIRIHYPMRNLEVWNHAKSVSLMEHLLTVQEVVRFNDIYFNKYTADLLDDRARDIIKQIDQTEMLGKYAIESRFDGSRLNIDKLSTGCKTALNVMYNPNNIFDICECGENALEVIYGMDAGKVYCEYPMIALDTNNQYIIIGRNPTSLMLSQDEILELDSVKNDDRMVFSLKKAFG